MACLPSANVFSLTYRMVAIRPLIVAASSGSSRSTDGLKRIGASAALRGKIKGAFIETSRLFQPPAFVRHVATKLHSTHVSTCPYVRVRTLWPRCFATKKPMLAQKRRRKYEPGHAEAGDPALSTCKIIRKTAPCG